MFYVYYEGREMSRHRTYETAHKAAGRMARGRGSYRHIEVRDAQGEPCVLGHEAVGEHIEAVVKSALETLQVRGVSLETARRIKSEAALRGWTMARVIEEAYRDWPDKKA